MLKQSLRIGVTERPWPVRNGGQRRFRTCHVQHPRYCLRVAPTAELTEPGTAESLIVRIPEWLRAGTMLVGGYIFGSALIEPFANDLAKPIKRQLRPIRCKVCLGIGDNTCPDCNGRGKLGGLVTDEPLRDCEKCARVGRVRCPHCKATGLQNNWLFSPAREGERGWGPRGEP